MNNGRKMSIRAVMLIGLALLLFTSAVYSQRRDELVMTNYAALNGFVMDSSTKETLIGATISLQGTKFGAYTNKSGYFSITNIPPGEYTVMVSFLGYERITKKIKFAERQSLRADFKLASSSVKTREVEIMGEREVEKREITVSRVNIPIQQIKEIRVGGESDVFRTLQYLPGILTSSQLSSGLFVRGGSPDQNLVILDGSAVYNPTHLFGFISTFNSDAIKDVELIKGGFPAEYGGRLSAVLNITQKDGNQENYEGIASIGAISSRASVEGPLCNGSWFISGRRTYFEAIKAAMPEDPESPLPDFNFYDVNAKVSQRLSENDRVFLSGFASADRLDYSSFGMTMGLEISNRLASARWTHIFNENLFTVVNLSASRYNNRFEGDQSGYKFLVDNSITDYNIKGVLEWFTSDKVTHKFGFESSKLDFAYLQNFTGATDSTEEGITSGTLNVKVSDWIHSFFGQANYQFTDLMSLQTGLRVNYWDQAKIWTFDPRLAVRWQMLENVAVKGSWGIFHQNLRLATQPDFSFFDTWLPTDTSIAASRSFHYIFSVETQPFSGYDLNFDVYYKRMNNINEINTTQLEGNVVADLFYVGDADAYGVEVFLQKKYGRFTGWVGYALGFITAKFDSINGGAEFRPKYDRTHDFKVVGQYKLNDSWEFGAVFTFQSGQSYTGATSRFQSRLPDQNYGRGKIIPSQRYGLRLPPSHQLNLSASYLFKTFGLDSKLILDIYNVYNRRDIWFRYYNTRDIETKVEDVKLIPILPSISYEIKF